MGFGGDVVGSAGGEVDRAAARAMPAVPCDRTPTTAARRLRPDAAVRRPARDRGLRPDDAATWRAAAAPRRRADATSSTDPARYVDPATGHGPGPVRQRAARTRHRLRSASRSRETSNDRDRPDRGPRQALPGHARRRAASTSTSTRARSSASSARTAPARRRRSGCSPRCSRRRPATPRSPAIDVRRNPDAVRRVLGYMPDVFGVYDDMKVWEYLDFFARCYGLPAGRAGAG